VLEAGVVCSFFAAADNSADLAIRFLKGTVIGAAIALPYQLFLLPPVNGLVPLIAVQSLFYLPCGLMLASSRQAPAILPVILGFTISISVQNSYDLPFDTFLNNASSLVIGVAAAAITLRLFRSIGSDWVSRRLMDATQRDLARIAVADRALDRASFESRMFDRLNGLLIRRHADGSQQGLVRGNLASLRIGLNLFLFQAVESKLSLVAHRSARLARAELTRLFHRRRSSADQLAHACSLIQATINDIALEPLTAETKQAVLAFGGIRLLLLGHAAFFCRVPEMERPMTTSQGMVTA
jgi:uncharacterized membrane protein YccC